MDIHNEMQVLLGAAMIKRTLYFGNPAYLSTHLEQLVIRLPEVENNPMLPEAFKKEAQARIPIEDIGIVILDHQQAIISQALIAKLCISPLIDWTEI